MCSSSRMGLGSARPFVLQRLDLRDGAAYLADAARLFKLVSRSLETQVELLALQIGKLRLQLVVALHLEIGDLCHGFHAPQCASPRRTTTLVRIGSLAAARSKAPLATSCATPSSSNRMRSEARRVGKEVGGQFGSRWS